MLGQQDRQALLGTQLDQGLGHLADDVRLNAFGGLVQKQQPRLGNQGSRQGQQLLFPTRQRTTLAVQQAFQTGKQTQYPVQGGLLGFAQCGRPGHAQIFPSAQTSQNATPLLHIGQAQACPDVGRQRVEQYAVCLDGARPNRQYAGQGLHQRGLAHAIGTQDTHDFTAPHSQGETSQYRHRTIARLDAINPQGRLLLDRYPIRRIHALTPCCLPRYTSRTRSSDSTASALPCTRMRPR